MEEKTQEVTETPNTETSVETTKTETTVETPKAEEPKTLLDGEDKPTEAKTETPKEEVKKEPTSLLDDDEQEQKKEEAQAAAPSEEQVKAFTDAIKSTDLGDGVTWDDAALTAMTPALMEMTGGDAKKADKLVKAYTAHQQAMHKAWAENQDKFNNSLISQCREKFGEDLKKVAGLAKKGGLAVFGEKIWNEMKKVPSFANNPEIMERLADVGRKVSTDDGKVTPKDGGIEKSNEDVFHRMYGGVKI